jgi:hypothetical protein
MGIIVEVQIEDLSEYDRQMMLNGCGSRTNMRWFDPPELAFAET